MNYTNIILDIVKLVSAVLGGFIVGSICLKAYPDSFLKRFFFGVGILLLAFLAFADLRNL
jgi:uncharacterized membrane protein